MIAINEIKTSEIKKLLQQFEIYGGVIDFRIFQISGRNSILGGHLVSAKTTISSDALSSNDAKKISTKQFFRPYFDLNSKRPILLGKHGRKVDDITSFDQDFYFDEEEIVENVVTINSSGQFATKGYTDAFLRPPHTFGHGLTNLEIGRFFLEFNTAILGEFDSLEIYSWSTDYSSYFEDGKEWWGSFFWTVYSPSKDWFVSITASTTD